MNYSYFSYTRVIAVIALFFGVYLLWPGKLYLLDQDFIELLSRSEGKLLNTNSFRPVLDLSITIDWKLWGLNALGFHITNALLHLGATFLVYRLSLRLLQRYHFAGIADSNAMLIAAIFFVYAFHSESIYWIIGRSASLGSIWFLLSVITYLRRSEAVKFKVLSVVYFIIGLFTYESVWITPLVLILISWLDVKHQHTTWQNEIKFISVFLVALVISIVLRQIATSMVISSYEGEKFLQLDLRGLMVNYLKLILRSLARQTGNFYLLGIAFLISFTAIISFFLKKKVLAIAVFAMWLISYLPYLSLGVDTFGSEGERYLYLPSIFLSFIIGLGMINAVRTYKYVISLLFFSVHILLLNDARHAYEIASAITKSTVDSFSKLKGKETIYIIQLPQENNGVLIFRTGVEAANKLVNPARTPKLVIVSKYKGNYIFFNGTREENWYNELPGNKDKDAVLDYSSSTLNVYY